MQNATSTVAAIAAPAPHLNGTRAVFDNQTWLRLPRAGSRCPVSGLSRSGLCDLVRPNSRNDYTPPVESRLLKRKGAARGVLLISKQSLLDYINAAPAPTRAEVDEDDTSSIPVTDSTRAAILAQLDESARRVADTMKGVGL